MLSSPHSSAAQPRIAIFSGAFHPPTIAHLDLACAALRMASRVIFTIPQQQPHKAPVQPGLAERLSMLQELSSLEPRFSVRAVRDGLLVNIAAELQADLPAKARPAFVCGADAAERVLGWDYGSEGAVEAMLQKFDLLVAARGDVWLPPPQYRHAVHLMDASDLREVSSTEVRRRIAAGEEWHSLVPPAVHASVQRLYQAA
jgi:nicotinate-nucleotide adenylyltransferase